MLESNLKGDLPIQVRFGYSSHETHLLCVPLNCLHARSVLALCPGGRGLREKGKTGCSLDDDGVTDHYPQNEMYVLLSS